MKVSELTGKDLDNWVAKAQGWGGPFDKPATIKAEQFYWTRDGGLFDSEDRQFNYTPSTNGGQCFELMKIDSFRWVEKLRGEYNAMFNQLDKDVVVTSGPTLNIAICRAFVASVYGEEVSDGG